MEIGRVRVYPTPFSGTHNQISESPLSFLFTGLKPATFPFVKSEDPSIIIWHRPKAAEKQREISQPVQDYCRSFRKLIWLSTGLSKSESKATTYSIHGSTST
jgi:hypothetical protein